MTNTTQSKAQETMNQKYSELCQQRGSLSYQQVALNAQIADIDAQIKALNSLAPAMRKLELDLVAANTALETGQTDVTKTEKVTNIKGSSTT